MRPVVLVNCRPRSRADEIQREHLGLAYLSSFLLQTEHDVRLLDGSCLGLSERELANAIAASDPAVVGFSLFLNNTRSVLEVVRILRQIGSTAHITLGGHHATFNHRELLIDHPEVDSVIMGEGEESLAELAERLKAGSTWSDVRNLAYRCGVGHVIANPLRPLIAPLDRLPFPGRDAYAEWLRRDGIAGMVSSRGCYASCGFCSIRAFYRLSSGRAWRMRTPGNVVDEMELLVRSYGVREIIFLDDNFLGPGLLGRRRAKEIAADVIRRGLRVAFAVACRANDVERETLLALQKAGLSRVDLGIESFVPRQLALYDKAVTVEENRRAIQVLEETGLQYRLYLIPVDPYATVDDLLENLAGMKELGVDHLPYSIFNRLTAFKGTRLAERLGEDGLLEPGSNARAYMGEMPYRFREPGMDRVMDLADRVDRHVNEALRRLKLIFSWRSSGTAELEFGRKLMHAIHEGALDLATKALRMHREGREREARALLTRDLGAISRSVRRVEKFNREGGFKHFRTLEVSVGGRRVSYPVEAARLVTRELLARLARA